MIDSMIGYWKEAWLVLLLAGGLGVTLSFVDGSLEGRIEQNAKNRLERAVQSVVPGGVQSEETEVSHQRAFRVFDITKNQIGWALPAETMGFVDQIELLIGISLDGTQITGVAVLSSRETPGLGDRIREDEFLKQLVGRATTGTLTVVKVGQSTPKSIDAITGATISSRALIRAINAKVALVRGKFMDATTGEME